MKKLTLAVLLLLAGALPAQALDTKDILSLVEMPLAVAAVSELTGVPQDQLTDVLATLNQADVPPADFVDVVRYVPVALVDQPAAQDQTFAQWLDAQAQQTTGPQLVTSIDNHLSTTYGVAPAPVQPQRVVYVDDRYIPNEVVTRVSHPHPHGGPPGQLKKQLGLQTGAEVVHGEKRGRQFVVAPQPVVVTRVEREHEHGNGRGHGHGRGHEREVQVIPPPMASAAPPIVVQQPQPAFIPPGQAKKMGGGEGKGHGHGKD